MFGREKASLLANSVAWLIVFTNWLKINYPRHNYWLYAGYIDVDFGPGHQRECLYNYYIESLPPPQLPSLNSLMLYSNQTIVCTCVFISMYL